MSCAVVLLVGVQWVGFTHPWLISTLNIDLLWLLLPLLCRCRCPPTSQPYPVPLWERRADLAMCQGAAVRVPAVCRRSDEPAPVEFPCGSSCLVFYGTVVMAS